MKEIIAKLNKTFENKVRLGMMSALMVNQTVDFKGLKTLLDITDGNLSSNAAVLLKEEYIEMNKTFIDNKPNTSFTATEAGKKAFMEHLKALEELIGKSLS